MTYITTLSIEKTPKKQAMANPNPKTDHLNDPWKPGESGNPNGRPRKMVSQVLDDLGDAGIEHVTKEQVRGAIETLLNCQEEDLERYSQDNAHSMLVRIVARHMLEARDNDRLFNMLLDRAFGKPKQQTDITSGGEKIEGFNYIPPSDEADD